jgi:hypothetical protein
VDDDAVLEPEPRPGRPGGDGPGEILVIDDERGLITQGRAIIDRLRANPQSMRMLIINPVMAFADAGIKLTPSVANHVLHAVQYPPDVRAERTRLEQELKELLGRSPRPADSRWLADTVFGQLRVRPLDVDGASPVYRPSLDAETVARLVALLPTRGVVTVEPTAEGASAPAPAPAPLSFEPRSLRLLDLEAPVPAFPPAATTPTELTLVDLWFYKDSGPGLRQLLDLGILINSGVAIYPASEYRKIRDGQAQGELLSWISAVRIPVGAT